jgi:hypothetical protein
LKVLTVTLHFSYSCGYSADKTARNLRAAVTTVPDFSGRPVLRRRGRPEEALRHGFCFVEP